MDTFGFSTDWKVARSFYDLVRANLSYTDYSSSEDGERRRLGFEPDLFSLRGQFLGCVYCQVGEKIAGLYCLTEKDSKGYVDSGYVAQKYRGQGIGFELLQLSCDKLISMGNKPVCFIVRSKAMDRLIDRLPYEHDYVRKEDISFDDTLDDLDDFLFTQEERPPGSV